VASSRLKESGVEMPPVPQATGQGRALIEQALPYQFGAHATFALEPDGVRCAISLDIKRKRERTLKRPRNTEADDVTAVAGLVPVAVGGAEAPWIVVPGTAADNTK
jgi:hypothetical protein